jgi:glycosyltransferase involved in cell wall biosynthesis
MACVCTLDRPAELRECLNALIGQQACEGWNYCYLVVDNSTCQSARPIVTGLSRHTTNLRYVHEARKGVVYARNAALDKCYAMGADVALFTDDDCIPSPNWMLRAIEALISSDIHWISGEVIGRRSYQFARKESHVTSLRPVKLASTNNLVLRLERINRIRFNERFNTIGSEDKHFTLSLTRDGQTGAKAEGLIVYEVERAGKNLPAERSRRFSAGTYSTYLAYWHSGWTFDAILFFIKCVGLIVPLMLIVVIEQLTGRTWLKERLELRRSKYKGRIQGICRLLKRRDPSYFSTSSDDRQ